jgi:hypothetical protein
MTDRKRGAILQLLAGSATVLVLGAGATFGPQMFSAVGSAAWAQEGSGQGGQGEGKGGQGQGGQGNGGQGGQGQGGEGQGGPGEDSDGQGPKAGSGGSGGGKPVWASEGIPEVELGRLNVARSPDNVLDRAFTEAMSSVTPEMVAFYNLSTAEMISELSLNFDNVAYIDSPLQNLALMKDALDGTSSLATLGVTTDAMTLVAVHLAVAADKEGEGISTNTVIAVTTILGQPITGAEAEALAALAESIRLGVVAGHG